MPAGESDDCGIGVCSDFASPERETSRLGSADGSAKRTRLGIGPCNGSGGLVVRPPVVRRLLVDGPGFNGLGFAAAAAAGTDIAASAEPAGSNRPPLQRSPPSSRRSLSLAPAEPLVPPAADCTAAQPTSAAAGPPAAAGGLPPRPPPPAQQVQHYALVHPQQFATLAQLSRAIHTSMAATAGIPAAADMQLAPQNGRQSAACQPLLEGLEQGLPVAACNGFAAQHGSTAKAAGGISSTGSAAARSRLNALLEGV